MRSIAESVLFLVALAVLGGVANAAEEPGTTSDKRLAEWLERYPAADADSNGVLTTDEVRAYRQAMAEKKQQRKTHRPAPPAADFADVRYGDDERQVFDLWLPPSREHGTKPPVLAFFHGGGFVAGDKSGFDPSPYLEAGFAAMSSNYRFVNGGDSLSPIPFEDAVRAIQTLRHGAADFGVDGSRLAVSGSSAGAVIALWLGYHDDLANPDSEDPVARQSSRPACIAPINGPTNLDPKWIHEHLGGPAHVHGSFPKLFGAPVEQADEPAVRARIEAASPMQHLTPDDVPTCLVYTGRDEGIPLPESASTGVLIHHARFGKLLAERLGELGIDHQYHTAIDPRREPVIVDYLRKQFGEETAASE